jgi:DNA-binding NtrC family response regulator
VTAPGPVLQASDLRFSQFASGRGGARGSDSGSARQGDDIVVHVGMSIAEVEDRMIHAALLRTRGDKEEAARLLGLSARTLYRRASRPSDEGDAAHDPGAAESDPTTAPPASPPRR